MDNHPPDVGKWNGRNANATDLVMRYKVINVYHTFKYL